MRIHLVIFNSLTLDYIQEQAEISPLSYSQISPTFMLKKFIGESAFKLAGWKYHVEPDVLEDKQVIVGFEHTSMMDAVLSLALFQIYDIKIHTLIKKELFKGPMKPLLEAIGGISVDRKANQDIVSLMVEHFQQNEKFNLVIAPEATRAKTGESRKPIRTGFWYIAKAAGVPGTVMGLWEAHQKFGKLKWAEVIQPAIGYAENGFTVADTQSLYRTDVEKMYNGKTNFSKYFGNLKTGANFKQPELAKTLGRIAQNGANEFYRGETAKLLVAQMQRDGGLISAEDLDKYKVKWRKPMSFKWRDNVIHTAPLPSSGGIALRQLLAMKEYRAADFKGVPLNSAQYMHLVSEIEKRVFADRADYLGDPDYTKAPVKKLTSDAYLQKRAAEVNAEKISVTENVKPGLEPAHTTHFSILDKDGNAVANTYTLNWDYGNGVVVEGAGFLLNDEMDDFSAKAGAASVAAKGSAVPT